MSQLPTPLPIVKTAQDFAMALRRQGGDVLVRAMVERAQFLVRELRAGAAPNPSSIRKTFGAPGDQEKKVRAFLASRG
jgi:hypothetical protein